MKAFSIVAALITVILLGALLVPDSALIQAGLIPPPPPADPATAAAPAAIAGVELAMIRDWLPMAALAAAVLSFLAVLFRGGEAKAPAPRVRAVRPAPPPPPPSNQAEAEVVTLLATLQQKGRLVDFLMEDVTAYNDTQVAAAARVVHEGCQAVLKEHFQIGPIRREAEGASVTLPAGYPADEYRLVGKIAGQPPFSGTLVHRGWRTDAVKLPRVLKSTGDRLPAIAPAEVELR